MALIEETFMGSDHHEAQPSEFGAAVADALRRRYPYHTAKLVARDLNCTIKAAENLLANHLSGKSITRLGGVYGPGFLIDAVLAWAGMSLDRLIQEKAEAALNEQRKWDGEYQRLVALAEDARAYQPDRRERPDQSGRRDRHRGEAPL